MSSVDSMLSFEGQRLLASLVRVPAGTSVNSPPNDFSYTLTEPPTVLDEKYEWSKPCDGLFICR